MPSTQKPKACNHCSGCANKKACEVKAKWNADWDAYYDWWEAHNGKIPHDAAPPFLLLIIPSTPKVLSRDPPSPSLLVGGRYNDEKQRLTAENKALQSYLKEEKAARQREAAELKATHGENLKSVNKKWKGVVEATKNQHAAVVRRLERKIIDLEQGVSASSSE